MIKLILGKILMTKPIMAQLKVFELTMNKINMAKLTNE